MPDFYRLDHEPDMGIICTVDDNRLVLPETETYDDRILDWENLPTRRQPKPAKQPLSKMLCP